MLFAETINHRGLEQLLYIFEKLQVDASHTLPKEYAHLGDIVSIDGSFLDAVLSMHWADYRGSSKKAKAHLGFNVNSSIPQKIFLTDGKGDERPFVSKILSPSQTGIMDRYYQCHKDFDKWQTEEKHFVCRIKKRTHRAVIETRPVSLDSIIFMMLPFCLVHLMSIKQRNLFALSDTVSMAKNTGLLQIDMTSQQKKLHVFISFAGTSKYFLDGGSATLKSIILLQDRNTGSRYKYLEDLSRTCLLPCIATIIITKKCLSKE